MWHRKQTNKINKAKSQFMENINKIGKFLVRLIKERKEENKL